MHPKLTIVGSGVLAFGQMVMQLAPANGNVMGVIGVVNAVLSLSLFIAAVGFAFGYGKLHQRNDFLTASVEELKEAIAALEKKFDDSHERLREDIMKYMLGPRSVDRRDSGK